MQLPQILWYEFVHTPDNFDAQLVFCACQSVRHFLYNHVRCASGLKDFLSFLEHGRQPEINSLQWGAFIFGREQEILWLQVSMHDVVHVTVVHGSQNLLHKIRTPFLSEKPSALSRGDMVIV